MIRYVEYEYHMTHAEISSLRGKEGMKVIIDRYTFLRAKAKSEKREMKKAEKEAEHKRNRGW